MPAKEFRTLKLSLDHDFLSLYLGYHRRLKVGVRRSLRGRDSGSHDAPRGVPVQGAEQVHGGARDRRRHARGDPVHQDQARDRGHRASI